MCDYHDANYSIRILDRDRTEIDRTKEVRYNKEGPDNVKVEMRAGMQRNKMYTAIINVTTAVKSTTTEFSFGKYL